MCYVTLRGLVYFGASIHIYHGLQMLVNTYHQLFATTSESKGVSEVDVVFNTFFLTLGLFLFRGVEQKSKTWIKWPTIGFTLLLAGRFLLEIIKQVERERKGVEHLREHFIKELHQGQDQDNEEPPQGHRGSPFSYSSSSNYIDIDPLISAAVGIYIFILFVYNHSLEFTCSSHTHINHISMLPTSGLHNHSQSESFSNSSSNSNDTAFLVPGGLSRSQGGGLSRTLGNPLFELDLRSHSNSNNKVDAV